MYSEAWISDDGLYRYRLTRRWGAGRVMAWVMLNPSTADATEDDQTIRRCRSFAEREGCGGIVVVNLYALRSTDPRHLLDHPDPEGPSNPMAWAIALYGANLAYVVAAWGHGAGMSGLPDSQALAGYCAAPFHCLGTTKGGAPRHPARLAADTPLELWG